MDGADEGDDRVVPPILAQEDEEEEEAPSFPFTFLFWPRSSSILAMLVFLVTLLFALCSLRLSSGLRCSALGRHESEGQHHARRLPWQWHVQGWF